MTAPGRVLVLAPRGRDASVAVALLAEGGLAAEAVADLPALVAGLEAGAGAAVLAEEGLQPDPSRLRAWVEGQPAWSDLPFIVLTARGAGTSDDPSRLGLLDLLGNATLLDRPFHPLALVSLTRAALRSRAKQIEARRLVEARAGDAARIAQAEERARLAADASGLGIWGIDAGTMALDWDARCDALFGFAPGTRTSYEAALARIVDQDRARIDAAVGEAFAPGSTGLFDVDYRLRVPGDVSERWIASRGRVIFSDGRPLRLAGTLRDVTHAKRDEAQLRTLNLELAARVAEVAAERDRVWRLSRDLLSVADFEGRFLDVNPAWTATLGFDRATLLDTPYLNLIHPDDRDGVLADRDDLDTGATPDGFKRLELRMRHADGGYRTLAFTIVAEGGLMFSVGRDVTDERVAEAAREREQARARAIFDSTFQFQGFLSPEGTLVDANPTSLDAIGAGLADVAGLPFADAPWFTATPGAAAQVREALVAARAGEVVRTEMTLILPGGTRTFDFSLRPVLSASGEVIGLVPEATDVTERVRAEEALRQSQKLEAVGQLTGGVAHDFNNLLQVVSANLELLRPTAEAAGEAAARRLGAALQGVRRGASLTRQLLAFARRQALRPETIDPALLLRELADLLRRTLGETYEVRVEAAPGLWNILADPGSLQNAILNLAINARDAMPGGGRVTLGAANLDGNEACVALTVADDGPGMAPEVLARVFEPFFTTKPEGQGTGLGLAMVYGFAKQSGGDVSVASRPGEGTRVTITLPRDARASAAPRAEAAPAPGAGETILVAEDDDAVRAATAETLRGLGYRVRTAVSGEDALAVLRSGGPVDLLFSDVVMPGELRGPDLARAARSLHPDLPLLFASGYAQDALDAGALLGATLLAKPYAREELAGAIRLALGSRRGRAVVDYPGMDRVEDGGAMTGSTVPSDGKSPGVPGNAAAPAPVSGPRILIAEDDPIIAMATVEQLADLGRDAVEAETAAKALELLAADPGIGLLITDLGLPDMDGAALIDRALALRPALATIIASGRVDGGGASGSVRLVKPYTAEALARAIEQAEGRDRAEPRAA